MNPLSRAKFPFAGLTLAHQIQVVESVLGKCKTSPDLPPNDPVILALAQQTQELAAAEDDVLRHRREMLGAIAVRKDKHAAFHRGCFVFLGHINALSQGNPTVIRNVGLLDITGNHRPVAPVLMTTPQTLVVSTGSRPGEVHLKWRTVRKARSYLVERSTQAATGFVQVATVTAARAVLEGQPSATPLWYRVAAVGPAGAGAFCDGIAVVPR